MSRWSNNYYTQQAGRETPRPQHGLTSSPSSRLPHRRDSIMKTGNDGVVSLYVFRVAHLTQFTLKSFIERQGVRVLDIEQTSHKGTVYKSFMVAVTERDAPKLLEKRFWPGLVACRPLKNSDRWGNEGFSRRYPKEVVIPASPKDDANPHHGQGSGRVRVALIDKPKSVHLVTAQPYSTRITDKQMGKAKYYLSKNERKSDNLQNEKLKASKKNNLAEKRSKSATHTVGVTAKVPSKTATVKMKRKISVENTPERQEATRTTKIKVKRKISDENKLKKQDTTNIEKERISAPTSKTIRTGKSSFINYPNPNKNRKQKSKSVINKKSSKPEEKLGHDKTCEQRGQPQKPNISPLRIPTVNRKYKNLFSHKKPTETSQENFSKPKETQSNWFRPMQALLRLSSEEALGRLLGPDSARFMIHENISHKELFLGVRVLAHCARADVKANMQQNLVYMICQPQMITLIKKFTRVVEEKYKERAESYFWHLGEFLDLYIVHNIFLQGMLSLFTTCLSKILALSPKKYVSEDLVKVYRGMHSKVFTNLP